MFGMNNNRENGLTLIELLITIAVLAVIAAIAIPVVTNVVSTSNARALEEVNTTVDSFLGNFSNGGAFLYSSTDTTISGITVPERTFLGLVDLDGDGQLDSNEVIAELTVDSRWMVVDNVGDELITAAPSNLEYPTTASTITAATINVVER